jgi:hypothetical protein
MDAAIARCLSAKSATIDRDVTGDCKAISDTEFDHGRAPYVYVQRMNTDPNVHVSVSKETMHFAEFIERWLGSPETRTELLAGLSRTEMLPIPDPPV